MRQKSGPEKAPAEQVVKYLEFLREFVPDHETSHLLMVSHHPLAIAELDREQIQVMWRDSDGQEKLIRERRDLTSRKTLSPVELDRLRKLDDELASLGFSSKHWDEDYQEYPQIRSEVGAKEFAENAPDDPDTQRRRREAAARIVRDLI